MPMTPPKARVRQNLTQLELAHGRRSGRTSVEDAYRRFRGQLLQRVFHCEPDFTGSSGPTKAPPLPGS